MIISKTPMRVSFVGGGTDLPVFCNKERGAVISTAIKKYVYIVLHPSFDRKNLVAYSKIERTNHADGIMNTRVREAMKMTGITKGVEIHSIAEVPAGSGLGGSSSFTVGLLNALYAYQGKHVSNERLAKEACEIEIDILKEPIGRQDQYAAAYGGFNKIEFLKDEVKIKPIILKKKLRKKLEDSLLLFYLGGQRSASEILREQSKNVKSDDTILNMQIKMRDLADELEEHLAKENIDALGKLLNKNWQIKRQLASKISNEKIDEAYEKARNSGAIGGKLLGAGGTGFLLTHSKLDKLENVRRALSDFRETKIRFDWEGSKIIHMSD